MRTEKVGRVLTCRMEPAGLAVVEQWMSDRRANWERRFDRLGALLAGEKKPSASPAKEPAS